MSVQLWTHFIKQQINQNLWCKIVADFKLINDVHSRKNVLLQCHATTTIKYFIRLHPLWFLRHSPKKTQTSACLRQDTEFPRYKISLHTSKYVILSHSASWNPHKRPFQHLSDVSMYVLIMCANFLIDQGLDCRQIRCLHLHFHLDQHEPAGVSSVSNVMYTRAKRAKPA